MLAASQLRVAAGRRTTVMHSVKSNAGIDVLSKVPAVTLVFWIIKILATTVGETGGDSLSMTLKLGYFESTLIF